MSEGEARDMMLQAEIDLMCGDIKALRKGMKQFVKYYTGESILIHKKKRTLEVLMDEMKQASRYPECMAYYRWLVNAAKELLESATQTDKVKNALEMISENHVRGDEFWDLLHWIHEEESENK